MDTLTVQPEDAGRRLDVWLSGKFTGLSRARLQQLIRDGHVLVDGRPLKAHHHLRAGETVKMEQPPPAPVDVAPEDIPLDVLYEDEDLLVINKSAGLVVHPAAGHADGTLVNALLHHCRDPVTGRTTLAGVGGELRPGIVHRLDRDTSGALVIAKNDAALAGLAEQFKGRRVRKEYLALVWGAPEPERGTVETLVGRNPHNRKKMSARPASGRPAVTHYETVQRFAEVTLLRLRIETGRTHQIRVHLSHIGHPVVGDRQYGRARAHRLPREPARQMLHAARLAFEHPRTGAALEFDAPLPDDLRDLIRALSPQETAAGNPARAAPGSSLYSKKRGGLSASPSTRTTPTS